MAHVVTDKCTKCMACTKICPVTCIHPMEDEDGVDSVPQVYINPDECIDCGACVSECPVDAIYPGDELPDEKAGAAGENTAYFS